MKPHDLPALMSYLRAELDTAAGMSVALSGSLARGDFRTTTGGRVMSDLDLVPVVASDADVPAARAFLAPILQRTADRFHVQATAAITLKPVFAAVVHARYRTSISTDWLINALALPSPVLSSTPAAADPCPPEALPWLIQPVAYYLAKATSSDPHTNLVKARAAMTHLARRLRQDLPGTLDDLPRTLRNVVIEQRVRLLPSSEAYFAAPTRPGLQTSVRDEVFNENQGLPFEASALVALSSIPN